MKYKYPSKRFDFHEYYLANKAAIDLHNKKKHAADRARVNSIKNRPCMDCQGWFNPWQMQFDHRDPSKKDFDIGNMIGRNAWLRIAEEIAKCDVVCSNCHDERTHKQRLAREITVFKLKAIKGQSK